MSFQVLQLHFQSGYLLSCCDLTSLYVSLFPDHSLDAHFLHQGLCLHGGSCLFSRGSLIAAHVFPHPFLCLYLYFQSYLQEAIVYTGVIKPFLFSSVVLYIQVTHLSHNPPLIVLGYVVIGNILTVSFCVWIARFPNSY